MSGNIEQSTEQVEVTENVPVGAPEKPVEGIKESKAANVLPEGTTDVSEAPEDSTKPEESNKNSTEVKENIKTNLSQVSGLIEKAGLTMQEVAEYAKANEGKVDLDTLVALNETHGEAVASLIVDNIKSIHTERLEAANQRDTEIFNQAKELLSDVSSDPEQTGESIWKELATWSKDNISNENRTEINKLLAQGGLAAKLAVQELTTAFKESLGTTEFQEAALLDGDSKAISNNQDISKNEYNLELNKLLDSGHNYDESREVAALRVRRTKSLQRGIK